MDPIAVAAVIVIGLVALAAAFYLLKPDTK
jgi:hypothetical protein